MSPFSKHTGLLLFCLSVTQPLSAQVDIYFASPHGSITAPCTQADPCALSSAVGNAVDNDIIFLADGNYTSNDVSVVTLDKSLSLIGGWDGTTALPVVYDSSRFVSVIDGEGVRRGIVIEPQKRVTLESLTVANGYAQYMNGAGIYDLNATALTLQNVTFSRNVANSNVDSSTIYGGGLFISEGTLDINASTFEYNIAYGKASGNGAGIYANNTQLTITESDFHNNASWYGSAVYSESQNKTFTMDGNTVTHNGYSIRINNVSAYGGYSIVRVIGSQSSVENNIIEDNIMINSTTLYFWNGSLLFRNNRVMANRSNTKSGLYTYNTEPLMVINNIFSDNNTTYEDDAIVMFEHLQGSQNDHIFVNNTFANNSSTNDLYLYNSTSLAAANNIFSNSATGIRVDSYCAIDLYNTLWSSVQTRTSGSGTIITHNDVEGDAGFVNEAAQNYHIRASSDAIGNGLCIDTSPTDIDGDIRNSNGTCDIGADEFTTSGISPSLMMYLLY